MRFAVVVLVQVTMFTPYSFAGEAQQNKDRGKTQISVAVKSNDVSSRDPSKRCAYYIDGYLTTEMYRRSCVGFIQKEIEYESALKSVSSNAR